jgi:hypothetical protein
MMMYRITEDELHRLSAQQVFNYALRHLMAMGRRCANERGDCLYRDGKGGACVVGAFIPDSLYSRAFEFKSVRTLYAFANSPTLAAFIVRHGPLLEKLQQVHDSIHPSGWVWAMGRVAQIFALDERVLEDYNALESSDPLERVVVAENRTPQYFGPHDPIEATVTHTHYAMPRVVAMTSKMAALSLLGAKGIAPKVPEPHRPVYS